MMQAYGLYSHIRNNRIKSVLLLASFVLMLEAIAYCCALVFTAVTEEDFSFADDVAQAWNYMPICGGVAFAIALIWFIIAYFLHEKLMDAATQSHNLNRVQAGKLYVQLEALCISRGLPTPKLKIMETPALNAFASGLQPSTYAITLTRGLVEELTPAEIEAVLAHELTHIRNGDVRLMVIALIFSGVFSFLGEFFLRSGDGSDLSYYSGRSLWSWLRSNDEKEEAAKWGLNILMAMAIALATIALTWGLSFIARMALSRTREYLADAGAVELTKNPDALISALQKIGAKAEVMSSPPSMAAFYIANPLSDAGESWFATHPSLSNRLSALVKFAGGRAAMPQQRLVGPLARKPFGKRQTLSL